MRFVLQRYGTWAWLDLDAPMVSSGGPEWALSSFGVMRATIPAAAPFTAMAEDGRPVLEEWGTLVHVETDGDADRRRWTGVVSEVSQTDGGWDITVREFPGYFEGIPFEGLVRGVGEDPADVLAALVVDVQGWQNSWLNIGVRTDYLGAPPPLGTDLDDRIAAARAVVDARQEAYDVVTKAKNDGTKATQDLVDTLSDEVEFARRLVTEAQQAVIVLIAADAPNAQIMAARAVVTTRQAEYQSALDAYDVELDAARAILAGKKLSKDAAKTALDDAREALKVLKDERSERGGAFEIRGDDDLRDVYRAIGDICAAGGLEWTTETVYSDGHPVLTMVAHYPSAGRRRDDLVFDTSMNILDPLRLETGGDYANAAVGVGAGEGAAQVRRSKNLDSARLRRPVVVADKGLRTEAQVDTLMNARLIECSGDPYVKEIRVRDHDNCRIGSWSVGDVIMVRGKTTTGGDYSGLARIESWSWTKTFEALLRLAPVALI